MLDLILQGALTFGLIRRIQQSSGALTVEQPDDEVWRFRSARPLPAFNALLPDLEELCIDHAFVPPGLQLSNFRLIVFDMDSTLINVECIDELAVYAGKKTEVARLTESAMRGELDFHDSLRRRVALLKGLPQEVLQRVYDERLQLNPGGTEVLEASRNAGLKTAVISGGFKDIADRLCRDHGIDFAVSNVLSRSDGILDGSVSGEIIDAEAKLKHFRRLQRQLNVSTSQCIAVGDGANDLLTLQAAGLSVAYHAKTVLRQAADVCIDFGGLQRLLPLFDRQA